MMSCSDDYCRWLAEQRNFTVPPQDACCEYSLEPGAAKKAQGVRQTPAGSPAVETRSDRRLAAAAAA